VTSPKPRKNVSALALTLGAIAPPAAQQVDLQPATAATARSRQPAVQVVRIPTGSGFDWGDAGIGAAAGFGLSMLAIGGRLLITDKPRRQRQAAPQ
jgi:hypothetical protein